ncbi:MAG: hypothetical protein AB8E15_04915 [Bdellovibrionales bacterium]
MSKAKDFLRELSYAENHQNIAKKWGLERLKYMGRTKFSGYSVRLNSGYRLMYRITSSNAIQVERISKNASHARGH